jgi:hypothetical protein
MLGGRGGRITLKARRSSVETTLVSSLVSLSSLVDLQAPMPTVPRMMAVAPSSMAATEIVDCIVLPFHPRSAWVPLSTDRRVTGAKRYRHFPVSRFTGRLALSAPPAK